MKIGTSSRSLFKHDKIWNACSIIFIKDFAPGDSFRNTAPLPSEIIVALSLPWAGVDRRTLGDGSEKTFEVYAVTVIWDGEYQSIPVNAAETEPLLGMIYTLWLWFADLNSGRWYRHNWGIEVYELTLVKY